MRHWPVLWQQFGLRPMDVEHLTLTEAISVEHALEQWSANNR